MIILRTRNEYKFADEGMNISWKKTRKKKKSDNLSEKCQWIKLSLPSFQWDSSNLDRTPLLLQ